MIVGISKQKITPSEPMYLDGQGSRVGKSQGVLDDIYVTALVLKQTETYVWLSYEFVDMQRVYSEEIMNRVADAIHVPAHHVIVSFTHTHSAPCLQLDPLWSFHYAPEETKAYREWIIEQTIIAIKHAVDTSCECQMYTAVKTIEGCYGNRNGITREKDNKVQLLQFRSGHETIATVVNMACHPTVLGPSNYFISGDVFGRLQAMLNKAWGCEVFMMQGAAGDMGNRQYRKGEDNEELIRTSFDISKQLLRDIEWNELPDTIIKVHQYHDAFNVPISKATVDKDLVNVDSSLNDPQLSRDERKLLLTMKEWYEKLKTMPDEVAVVFDGWYIKLGNVLIITIPSELNSYFALKIRDCFQDYQCFIWGYVYYSNGYLVEESEYGKHFESIVSMIPKGKSEAYIDFIINDIIHWLHA